MSKSTRPLLGAIVSVLLLFCVVGAASAQIGTDGILDHVYASYTSVAATWAGSIKARASWLFWTLSLISMVWTFGTMAIRKADIAEFFAEFIRFIVFTGVFWWFLDNGPTLATAIIDSMRTLGADASASSSSGTVPLPTPSGIVDIGFNLLYKVMEKSTVWSPVNSTVGFFLSIIILLILALVAVNMLIIMISAWIMAYAVILFLVFGGSRWTSDMAINYFKNVLAVAAQIFTMVLIVGIGKHFIEDFYSHLSEDIAIPEMAAVMVAALILLSLVNKLPPLVGGLATGGGIGSLGGGYGAAHAAAAIGMAAASISTAASVLTSFASNALGTANSIHEAFKKARDYENSAEGLRDSMQSQAQNKSGINQGESGPAWAGGSNGANDPSTPNRQGGGGTGASSGNSSTGQGKAVGGGAQGSSLLAKGAKGARIGLGTIGNFGGGIYDTAKGAIGNRIANSTMGKVASTIKASANGQAQAGTGTGHNALSAGSDKQVDRDAEVAAFRDRKPYTEGDDDGDHVN